MNRIAIGMAKSALEAAFQAAHEWFAEMGSEGARVLEAFETTRPVSTSIMARELVMTVAEADALARACASAVHDLTMWTTQTSSDRAYRRQLVEALVQLSKVGL